MWCHAWRIGYHDQDVRASAANATTNDATAPSPSRTASKLIRASAPTMSIRSTCMTLGRPIHAWMPSLELTNGAMHVYATRPSTFPHNHYHHPICESCHCQCRMITSTRAGGCMCSIFGGMYGWAVVDDRLDLIPSHPPIGRIIPLRWVLGRRSRTRPWTRTPSMWCHAWRIGYHDQNVRTSTAMPPPTMPPLSPSRTAS